MITFPDFKLGEGSSRTWARQQQNPEVGGVALSQERPPPVLLGGGQLGESRVLYSEAGEAGHPLWDRRVLSLGCVLQLPGELCRDV